MNDRERIDAYQEGPRIFHHHLTAGEWSLLESIRANGANWYPITGAFEDWRKRRAREWYNNAA